ncbi:Response regulator PleD [Rubripirellula tenax]|uniref:Translational regulator CsrA n=1 Tax=Rubripirellula tenax TaxID=2528015 RepID=A0A5C6FG50_9BACT|nr:response regulator [Rubripirellula tenax]TWU59154.1 Response regulator PleD [Rubripirellula tenax]
MLVLSRKADQSVHFPNLGIKVEILSVNGKTVKVGVDAPREVAILRGEIDRVEAEQASTNTSSQNPEERHELRNQIHTAKLALHMLQRQLDAGDTDKAEKTLTRALGALSNLDQMATVPVGVRKELGKDSPCRALVVEDNINERQLMKGFLEMCGYQVDAVGNGHAALGYLAENSHPDIVLLDVNMPGLDGPSTVSAIRSNPAYNGIKLYMVSGEDQDGVNVTVGEHGIQQWFSKPLDPSLFASDLAKSVAVSA